MRTKTRISHPKRVLSASHQWKIFVLFAFFRFNKNWRTYDSWEIKDEWWPRIGGKIITNCGECAAQCRGTWCNLFPAGLEITEARPLYPITMSLKSNKYCCPPATWQSEQILTSLIPSYLKEEKHQLNITKSSKRKNTRKWREFFNAGIYNKENRQMPAWR